MCCCKICCRICPCNLCTTYRTLLRTDLEKETEAVIKFARSEIAGFKQGELKDFLRDQIGSCVTSITTGGFFKVDYKIGPIGSRMSVCKKSFGSVYDKGNTYLSELIAELKPRSDFNGKCVRNSERPSSSSKPPVEGKEIAALEKFGRQLNIPEIGEVIQNVKLGNSSLYLSCVCWMESYFKTVGCNPPNSDAEIHLDFVEKTAIHEEYVSDQEVARRPYVVYSSFCKIWATNFSHVSIRAFKQVGGKCDTCGNLHEWSSLCRDVSRREYCSTLRNFHRATFMGERKAYYRRIQESLSNPTTIWSFIEDGMQQAHNQIPWRANLSQFASPLKQHLQGILSHGQRMVIYRTFHNVRNGANLSMHVFLCELRKSSLKIGTCVETIYHQIDGGSENACSAWIGLCELIIARRVLGIKKIVLSRLPVGHTHEDIDSKFALIWTHCRQRFVGTPQLAMQFYLEALHRAGLPAFVVDLKAIPDYCGILNPCIDRHFGRAFKRSDTHDWTQLQFIMERVDVSEEFPLGVKTMSRQFAQDEVNLIVPKPDALPDEVPFQVVHLKVIPQEQPSAARPSGGYYVLQKFPSGVISPQPFVEGSHADLLKTVHQVKKTFSSNKDVIRQWELFQNSCPDDDDCVKWVEKFPLDIPFREDLFCGQQTAPTRTEDGALVVGLTTQPRPRLQAITQPSVTWSGRRLPSKKSSQIAPYLIVGEPPRPSGVIRQETQIVRRRKVPIPAGGGAVATTKVRAKGHTPICEAVRVQLVTAGDEVNTTKRALSDSTNTESITDSVAWQSKKLGVRRLGPPILAPRRSTHARSKICLSLRRKKVAITEGNNTEQPQVRQKRKMPAEGQVCPDEEAALSGKRKLTGQAWHDFELNEQIRNLGDKRKRRAVNKD